MLGLLPKPPCQYPSSGTQALNNHPLPRQQCLPHPGLYT